MKWKYIQRNNENTYKETRKYEQYTATTTKKQSTETVSAKTQMLDLLYKDFKSDILSIFKKLK